MTTLRVSLKSGTNRPGSHIYDNQINAENFKEFALVLRDLSNYGIPIEKAFKEFLLKKKSDWEAVIGG